jgi:hypothetical protein
MTRASRGFLSRSGSDRSSIVSVSQYKRTSSWASRAAERFQPCPIIGTKPRRNTLSEMIIALPAIEGARAAPTAVDPLWTMPGHLSRFPAAPRFERVFTGRRLNAALAQDLSERSTASITNRGRSRNQRPMVRWPPVIGEAHGSRGCFSGVVRTRGRVTPSARSG